MRRYRVLWSAGNTVGEFDASGKRRAQSDARRIVQGNLTPGSRGGWEIRDRKAGDETIAHGTIHRHA